MNEHEAARIASAINRLRPDWHEASLRTLITSKLGDRPRRDVAVALAWVACETNSATPARVLEAGPWWRAAAVDAHRTPGPDKHNPATSCGVCSKHREDCERTEAGLPADLRHDFAPDFRPDRPGSAEAVAALKANIQPAKEK